MRYSAQKGTGDILPADIYKWQKTEKMFADVCHSFGYEEIRIPTFEQTDLFQRGVGDTTDVVTKEMYTFDDKGGRSITLRPEGTAGVVRSYIENGMSSLAKEAYEAFWAKHDKNPRLMKLLFTNPDSALTFVNERWFNYYLIKTGLILKNTHMAHKTSIINLFTDEDVYDLWQIENAHWYILHGASLLNGAKQPYSQRYLLRQLIADADSCIRQERPNVQLRFGHETVLLPLVCLIGVNGFDLQTESLEELEEKGWMASLVFPMASNLQFVFYRSDLNDEDIVFKVLLNEREAALPIPTDMAPYYHWRDFRTFYLNKLDSYQP